MKHNLRSQSNPRSEFDFPIKEIKLDVPKSSRHKIGVTTLLPKDKISVTVEDRSDYHTNQWRKNDTHSHEQLDYIRRLHRKINVRSLVPIFLFWPSQSAQSGRAHALIILINSKLIYLGRMTIMPAEN
jgi:hypothetical protein